MSTHTTARTTCTRCGAALACAMADGADGPCWCTALPQVVPVPAADAAAGCWCRACLEQHIAQSATAAPATPRPASSSGSSSG